MDVESILDGTWGSGAAPEEWMCFELMQEMHWTWRDYEETPLFVRQFCWDFIMRRRRVQRGEYEKQMAARGTPGIRRVKR